MCGQPYERMRSTRIGDIAEVWRAARAFGTAMPKQSSHMGRWVRASVNGSLRERLLPPATGEPIEYET